MRILFTRFPLESHFGGAEAQTLSLMKGLQEQDHEVRFLGSCPVLLRGTRELGIRNYELRIGNPPVTKWEAISFLWRKKMMKEKLIEQIPEIDVIFMLSLSEKLLLTKWAVSKGIKVFWIEHDRVGRWLRWNPWLPKLRSLSRIITTVVVSDLSRDLYLQLGWPPERTITIPNGIDTRRFASRPDPRPRPFRVGCIARLTHDKGVDLLIRAVADLPNVTLTIVGQGREEDHLRALAKSIDEKRIHFLPTIDPPAFFQTIDCLVLPSRDHDPFGLVIAEAMAAGLPTILTDACGIARHLTGDEALIVPAGNVQALKVALQNVQEKEVFERLQSNGPRTAEEKFSLSQMVNAYSALL